VSVGKSPEKTATGISSTTGIEALREWCIRNGIATADEIDSSLRIQRSAQLSGKPPPRLEEILVARGILTPHQVATALAATNQEPRADEFPPPRSQPQEVGTPSFASSLPPGRPERFRSARTIAVLIVIGAVVVAAGSALVHSFLPPPMERGTFEAREAEVHRAISSFSSRFAQALARRLRDEAAGTAQAERAARLEEETGWIVRLQDRVADRLFVRSVACPSHCLVREGSAGVRILNANAAGLRISRDGAEEILPWESLRPPELVDIVRAVLHDPDDGDLLGLGILAHRNHLSADAAGFFALVRSSAEKSAAQRYR
jgi:hypothetical protein